MLIVERNSGFPKGELIPEKPTKADIQRLYGCGAKPYKCTKFFRAECPHANICDFAGEGLVTLTPTDDPKVFVLTAEYHE